MHLNRLLEGMAKVGASDLHLKVNTPPIMRVFSRLRNIDHPKLTAQELEETALSLLNDRLKAIFMSDGAVDFSYEIPGVARYRVAAFRQREAISMTFRCIKLDIPDLETLNMPDAIIPLTNLTHGLVLVTGITGSGKSTTLAAMVNKINRTRRTHVVTVEDPVEYVYTDQKSIINQMEVGPDCPSFKVAMRRILRLDPDIILIGEMRDRETVETALEAVDTGHLVFSTLHTSDAKETVNRILHFFEVKEEQMILDSIAHNLRGIISQRLLGRIDKDGIIPAVELLLNVPIIQKLIREGRIDDIQQVLKGQEAGMQSFDVALALRVREGSISQEDAIRYSSDPSGIRRMIRGEFSSADRGGLVG